jgi:hypothetical protein
MDRRKLFSRAQEAEPPEMFGEPLEQDGVTFIPVARLVRPLLGGSRTPPLTPIRAYVIRDGNVQWEPAFDLNRVVLVGKLVALVVLLWTLHGAQQPPTVRGVPRSERTGRGAGSPPRSAQASWHSRSGDSPRHPGRNRHRASKQPEPGAAG